MSIRKIKFEIGEFYHLYNRGNSKQEIFLDENDYLRFRDLLYALNNEDKFNFSDSLKGVSVYNRSSQNPLVAIGSYCLMPNHFHILLTPLVENGVSRFMQKLSTAYVMYFNLKYKRTGGLFEGKFKAQYINNDKYLKYIFSYIHLNPIKLIQKDWKEKGVKNKKQSLDYLSNYLYSSYIDFAGVNRIEKMILNLENFPNYFPTKKSFNAEIFDWINYDKTL
ncbi:MAG: transposase [Candidatus Paceibacterota bacterium]